MRNDRRAGGATVAAALVGLCALAGCSGSHDAADSHNTTSSTSAVVVTSTSAPSSTAASAASAVLEAYRAGWTAFEQALADANPNAPAVARIDFAPELPSKQVEAIRAVRYFPAVKALAHCKERAWETLDGIFGGSSATHRLHQQCWYPSDNATAETNEDLLAGSGRDLRRG